MALLIHGLMDDEKCYQLVRQQRWPDGVRCPHCNASQVVKNGHDTTERCRQRYRCAACGRCFDDLTGTVFAGHHQPLRVWMLCSYLMGLNLSNRQIAQELNLSTTQAQVMTSHLRQGVADRTEPVQLAGEVECDEVYVVAGHKGNPAAAQKKGEKPVVVA